MSDVQPVSGALGARMEGLDLADLSESAFADLRRALDEHLVLYLPNQQLDRFQLSVLGRRFGPPFLHPIVNNGFSDCPDVLELLRKPEDRRSFGGENWHADVTWMRPGGYVSILHAIEVPEVGGDTGFASTIAAFASLSDGLKQLLRRLNAVHAYHWFEGREEPEFSAVHPVVRNHPETGCEGLYINRMFTNRFEHMSVVESAPLLDYLFNHMQRHDHTCRFRWQAGGVIVWDNRFTLHYPINDLHGVQRRMIRTTSMEAA